MESSGDGGAPSARAADDDAPAPPPPPPPTILPPSPPDAEDGAPGEAEAAAAAAAAPPPPPAPTISPRSAPPQMPILAGPLLTAVRPRPAMAAAADPAAAAAASPSADAPSTATSSSSWWSRGSAKREDVPKLFYNPTGVAAQILAVAGAAAAPAEAAAASSAAAADPNAAPTATLFSPFSPPPWLLSPHAQSGMAMARVVMARRHGGYSERQQILTADGGTLALDWWAPHAPEPTQRRLPAVYGGASSSSQSSSSQLRRQWLSDAAPVALLIHGINGGSFEGYILSCCAELASRGVRPVVLNLRGCGGTELTSGRGYTALQAPDVGVAVGSVAARYPRAPLLGVGFSLGAVLMAKYVAEADMGLISPHLPATATTTTTANAASPSAPPPPLRPATASGSGFVAVALVSSPVCLHCINARMASPLTHPMPFIYNLLVAAKLRGYWRRHESAFAESGLIPREPPPPEPRAPAPPNPARATPSLVAMSAAKAAHEQGQGQQLQQQQRQRRLVAAGSGAGAGGRAAGLGGGGGEAGGAASAAPSRLAGGGGRAAGSGSGWLSGAPLAVLERERARPVNAAKPSMATGPSAARPPRLPPRRKDSGGGGGAGEPTTTAAPAPAPAPAAAATATTAPTVPAHLRNVGLTTAGFDGELMRQLGFSDRAGYYRHACSTNYLPHARTPTLLLVSKDDPFLGTVPARLCSASPWTVLALTRRGGHIGWAHGAVGQKCWSDAAVADWLMAALALWRRQPAGSGWVSCAARAGGGSNGGGGGFANARALSPALRAPRTPKEREAASRALADAACTCLAQQELRRRQREAARREDGGNGGVRSRL